LASVRKNIQRRVEQDGSVTATHGHVMAKLRLTGCNRVQFDAALRELEESGVITVSKTETHTTITPR